MNHAGQIVRIVPSMGLVYIADSRGDIFSFGLGAVEGYRGEPLADLGLEIGARLDFHVGQDKQILKVTKSGEGAKTKAQSTQDFK